MSYFRVHTSPGHLMVFLDERLAPCTMACSFCEVSVRRARVRTSEAVDADVVGAAAELRVLLATHRPALVDLVSDDVLAFPGVWALLDEARAAGVPARLVTAGLRLADRAVAQRVRDAGARVVVTLLSAQAERYAAIAGRADARDAVFLAVQTARAVGVALDVGIVVLDQNVDELPALVLAARDLGSDPVAVRVFHPDVYEAPPEHYLQYPAWSAVMAGLRALAGATPLPRIELSNVPWCAVDVHAVRKLPVRLVSTPNEVAVFPLPACTTCAARPRCTGVHPAYLTQHGAWTVDPEQVAAALAWDAEREASVRQDRLPGVPNRPDEALVAMAVWPDAERRLGVEPVRAGAGYFFTADGVGAFYGGALDAEREGRFRDGLRATVRKLREQGDGVSQADVVSAVRALADELSR